MLPANDIFIKIRTEIEAVHEVIKSSMPAHLRPYIHTFGFSQAHRPYRYWTDHPGISRFSYGISQCRFNWHRHCAVSDRVSIGISILLGLRMIFYLVRLGFISFSPCSRFIWLIQSYHRLRLLRRSDSDQLGDFLQKSCVADPCAGALFNRKSFIPIAHAAFEWVKCGTFLKRSTARLQFQPITISHRLILLPIR